MNYTVSGLDNQLKNESLVPELPFLNEVPKTLRPYPNWVCWTYQQSPIGKLKRVPVPPIGPFDEIYKRCNDESYGLGFVLSPEDPFTVICIEDYMDKNGDLRPDAEGILKLTQTYSPFDDILGELYIAGYTGDLAWHICKERIRMVSDKFILPITGKTQGVFPDVADRAREFVKVSRRYCTQGWRERLETYEMSENQTEGSVLLALLKEWLLDEEWLKNADETDVWAFLNRCYKFTEPRMYFRSYMRENRYDRNLKNDIEQFIKEAGDIPKRQEDRKQNGPQPISDENAKITLDDMLQYDTRGSKVLENFYNMGLILKHHQDWEGRIRFDEFRNRPVLDGITVSDETEYRIAEWLGREFSFGGNKRQLLSDAIKSVASKDKYDALIEWMDNLPDWDGTERLEAWMIDMCGTEDSDYSKWVSRVTILQMVNRALNPGCIARLVPIWNGKENQGKSTAISMLGGEWATTLKISLENKEAHMAIHGYWIAELEELDTLYKTSEARLKAFLTNTTDHYVPKYANHSVDYPRRTVFIGTTNDSDYLRGLTGNTRFLPINTGDFDLSAIKDAREQLFAEASEWLAENPEANWWEEPENIRPVIQEERNSRRVINVYEEDLQQFLDGNSPTSPGYRWKTTWRDICADYLELKSKSDWKDKSLQSQVTDALKALGWTRQKAGGKTYWVRPGASAGHDKGDDDVVPF